MYLWFNMLLLLMVSSQVVAADTRDNSPKTVVVSYQRIPQEYVVDGVVEAVKQATVSAQTSGQVLDVYFDVDDFVEKDSVIVRLKSVEQVAELGHATAQVTEARAQLAQTRARLQEAQREFDRVKSAFDKQALAAVALDKAIADLDQAKADVEAAKARLEAASANTKRTTEKVDYTVIKAPYSGVVLQRHIEPGEMAKAGQPIMTGYAVDALRTVAVVSQSQLSAIREHMKARIILRTDQGERSFVGKKVIIVPYADSQSHAFKVRVEFPPNTPGVYPGMFTKVAFTVGEEKRLMIPQTAMAYRGEVRAVYVVDKNKKIFMRPVKLGMSYLDKVEILSGLGDGEQIALNPVDATIALKVQRTEAAQE